MFTFVCMVFKNKKKDYGMLLLILTLLMSFEFCFLAMYDALSRLGLDAYLLMSMNSIPTLSIFIALTLGIFVVKYFIDNKKQEFSILLLSGRKPKDLFFYLIIQFGLLSLISLILGVGIGSAIMLLIQYIIDSLSLSYSLTYQLSSVLSLYLCFLCISIIGILAVASRQFVILDTNLSTYLSNKSTTNLKIVPIKVSANSSKKKIPIFSIFLSALYLYITVTQLKLIMDPQMSLYNLLMAFMLSLAGIIFIMNILIPLLYDILHDRILLKHPILMNGLAQFNSFLKTLMTLLNLNACILPILLFLLFFSEQNNLIQVILVPCFIMNIIMIILCFILRFSIYNKQQLPSLAIFHSLGYRSQQLFFISLIKNSIFALFGIFIPFFLLYQLFIKAIREGFINQDLGVILMIFYVIVYIGLVIFIMIKERLSQKEVVNHVKYLNRGQ
ncbi:MAG: FtsX-like permease family protein [Coprobacillus sp.]